mmetsp:Transcript_2358/g.5520  ORF Transcript_2358/g.5520 Transcript_2358/m.5520 type:complete len:358 (+) Transcript_2358:61-1134(+)
MSEKCSWLVVHSEATLSARSRHQAEPRKLLRWDWNCGVGRIARLVLKVALCSRRAARHVVVAADRILVRAAVVYQALVKDLKQAAARGVGRAGLVLVTLLLRGRGWPRRRGWWWWWVNALLEWVARHLGNAADSRGRDAHGHTHVALLSPPGTPRVLHEPVVLALLGPVAGHENAVVELGATFLVVEDSARVELEEALVGLDGHGKRLIGDNLQHLRLVTFVHVLVAIDRDDDPVEPSVVASLLDSLVRVVLLGVDAVVFLDELEGEVHQASVAPVVVQAVTVHELLLAEGHKVVAHNGVDAFNGSCGGEGPATPATLLVLDFSDSSPLDPVHTVPGDAGRNEGTGHLGPVHHTVRK